MSGVLCEKCGARLPSQMAYDVHREEHHDPLSLPRRDGKVPRHLCLWCGAPVKRGFCSRRCKQAFEAQQRDQKRDNPFLARPEPLTGRPFKGYDYYLAHSRVKLAEGHILAASDAAIPSQQRKQQERQ